MKPKIPPLTIDTLTGAIGDVVRSSNAWGAAAQGDDIGEAYIPAVAQAVAQLLALVIQREPTDGELIACLGGQ